MRDQPEELIDLDTKTLGRVPAGGGHRPLGRAARAFCYTNSRAFLDVMGTLQIRHKITRPYSPQTNGKAERLIQTLLAECAYARLYPSNEDRQEARPKWLHHYNFHRPHTALRGQRPAARVNNLCRHYT